MSTSRLNHELLESLVDRCAIPSREEINRPTRLLECGSGPYLRRTRTRWYGEHLRPDWRKKSVAEARAIFGELGLVHPVWALAAQEGRF